MLRYGIRKWPQLQPLGQYVSVASKKSSLHRTFSLSSPFAIVRPFLLPDPGEGIKEVQIIQWFVEPGARVEQFDKICEVQSDKSVVEITSRFDGVVKKLHYDTDDVAQVGNPLFDIDVQSDISPENEASLAPTPPQAESPSSLQQPQKAAEQHGQQSDGKDPTQNTPVPLSKHAVLATPAVRGIIKELDVDIIDIRGTGKDGRVLKDDVYKYVESRESRAMSGSGLEPLRPSSGTNSGQVENRITLTPIQNQMFKTMTRSLNIPHFLYTDEVDVTRLSALRGCLNAQAGNQPRLSYLHFVIKALSLALEEFPLLNARVEAGNEQDRPQLVTREKHNIGVAMDSAQGLLVPNIKNVSSRSVLDIASETVRLQKLCKDGKLAVTDLTGGTITVSNIGSIGGTYLAPVIVQSEVAILGIGKARIVPAFDEQDRVVKKEIVNFSWSADHRVVDGATLARMAERIRTLLEEPGLMLARLR